MGANNIPRVLLCENANVHFQKNMPKYLWVSICSLIQRTQRLLHRTCRAYKQRASRFSENSFSTPYGKFVSVCVCACVRLQWHLNANVFYAIKNDGTFTKLDTFVTYSIFRSKLMFFSLSCYYSFQQTMSTLLF